MTKNRTPERQARIERVLQQRQPSLTLVLANIHDPHNVSAIYRSCDAFGVPEVHLYYTDTPFPALGKRTSASARKWVDTIRHNDKESLIHTLKEKGMQILATSCTNNARPARLWNLTQPTAIIMGNEHSGVAPELTTNIDGEIYIPMRGMIQSFNVSVAAAILLAEADRQRDEKGMFQNIHYNETDYAQKLEEWLSR